VSKPRKRRLLVIDDDASLRTLFRRMLSREGFDVDLASDGDAGLAYIRDSDYDVIILDLMMTGVSGFDVLDQLMQNRPSLLQRVVVASAASVRTLEQFDAGKVHALVRKPFDMDEFLAVVRGCANQ